jgi:hypothetical protein
MSDERPRLRPLEAFPVLENGQRHLALRDPSGMTDAIARLPPAVVAIVQLFDGETSRDEICTEYQRRYNAPLPRNVLDRIIDQLDQALLLDTERFRLHSASVFAEFTQSPVRAAHQAPASTPTHTAPARPAIAPARCRARSWRRTSTFSAAARPTPGPTSRSPKRRSGRISWWS